MFDYSTIVNKALFEGRIIIPSEGVTIDRYRLNGSFLVVRKHSFNKDSFSPENESGVDLGSPTAEVYIEDRLKNIGPAFAQVTNGKLIEDIDEFWIQVTACPTPEEYLRTGSLTIAYHALG